MFTMLDKQEHVVSISQFKTIQNKSDLDSAINMAKTNHLPILLDFSAKWCAACVKMEKTVFNNSDVTSKLNKFMLLRVDLTTADNENMNLVHLFNIIGPPVVLFFNHQGNLSALRTTGDVDANEFINILQKID
jgi:thiol:disulfide interchange protein